jgi:hypothetical protein
MMEFGIAAAKGMVSLAKIANEIRDPASQLIPELAKRGIVIASCSERASTGLEWIILRLSAASLYKF